MGRVNYKEEELKSMAQMILSANDYSKLLQQLNGKRMGLKNRLGPTRRLDLWAELIKEYK